MQIDRETIDRTNAELYGEEGLKSKERFLNSGIVGESFSDHRALDRIGLAIRSYKEGWFDALETVYKSEDSRK